MKVYTCTRLAVCLHFKICSHQLFFYITGSDGLQLDYVNIRTANRLLNCPVGVKLDDDEFYTVLCSTSMN